MSRIKEGDKRIITKTGEKIEILFVGNVFLRAEFPDGNKRIFRINEIKNVSKPK